MRIIRYPADGKLLSPVVALGTFDGVHNGHRQIIKAAISYAKRQKCHSAVITFDPHPQEIVAPERGLKLLTTLKEREELISQLGADSVIVINFNRRTQRLSNRAFVKKYLFKRLAVRQVFVGYDYAFGRGRSGDVSILKKLGRQYGFGVTVVPAVKFKHHLIKSGKIRELLAEGKFALALRLLGHPYRLTGKVVKGDGRGAKLGFPTANLNTDRDKLIPAQGVYFGYVDGKKCLVNIGSRPTFGERKQSVEVHILNFNQAIRGKTIRVDLFRRLRDEKQFADVEKLKQQIKKDIVQARRV
jgi:riboflavin kinase/FMN adenylyltransferase